MRDKGEVGDFVRIGMRVNFYRFYEFLVFCNAVRRDFRYVVGAFGEK